MFVHSFLRPCVPSVQMDIQTDFPTFKQFSGRHSYVQSDIRMFRHSDGHSDIQTVFRQMFIHSVVHLSTIQTVP